MTIAVPGKDRIEMSRRERDVLKVVQSVLDGKRSQSEAARLLDLSPRHVRRLQQRLAAGDDGALVHGLRGRPSNHRYDESFRKRVLRAYRQRYGDFGPTFASEKLAEEDLLVDAETLRRWLLAAGLWERQRRRDPHRSRRPRRSCFGELVQMDASIHDWLEGRGEEVVLITMIDDATNHVEARFYPAGTVAAHMDLAGRWLRRAHRALGPKQCLESILSLQETRVVSNDYTIRYRNRFYQLLKPIYAGERGGRVVIEERLDGTLAIRFADHYLHCEEIALRESSSGAARARPESKSEVPEAGATKSERDSTKESRSPGTRPTGGRSGRTPAEPYPPDGAARDTAKPSRRPAENHPWRRGFR